MSQPEPKENLGPTEAAPQVERTVIEPPRALDRTIVGVPPIGRERAVNRHAFALPRPTSGYLADDEDSSGIDPAWFDRPRPADDDFGLPMTDPLLPELNKTAQWIRRDHGASDGNSQRQPLDQAALEWLGAKVSGQPQGWNDKAAHDTLDDLTGSGSAVAPKEPAERLVEEFLTSPFSRPLVPSPANESDETAQVALLDPATLLSDGDEIEQPDAVVSSAVPDPGHAEPQFLAPALPDDGSGIAPAASSWAYSEAVEPPPGAPVAVAGDDPVVDAPPAARPVAEIATSGHIVAFFGCRGGAGTTTLAVNHAAQLARAGQEVCLVDLDLQLGDVLVALDLDLESFASFAGLARDYLSIDSSVLKRRLPRHASGVFAISQGGRLEELDANLSTILPGFLAYLARCFDVVVVDGVRDFSELALPVLDVAEQIVMVVSQDVTAVRRAQRALEVFDKLAIAPSKLRLLVNRHHRRASVKLPEIERALRQPVSATVRNDYKTALKAQNAGSLLTDLGRRKPIAKDVAALTTKLARPATAVTNGKAASR